MARIKSIAAVIAVLLLPGLAALAGLTLAPDARPPQVNPVVRIGESNTPRPTAPTTAPPTTTTTTKSPQPPPPIDDDDDDDGDDDGDG
ncbi:hypothetical protein LWC34_07210 [Kibdelosporangium philippinense]|uniref:Small secreted hydrophilic protein n=1 Tax=Kibdelosporangium philippinense TaxID=211113 RepID=A0ABS8Z757_9PSEU|nr:hypothetical protein [Kibdelosporangium philippinense]MCE7002620.1 hypothetical protein [Kibdelosporangium philippinense]